MEKRKRIKTFKGKDVKGQGVRVVGRLCQDRWENFRGENTRIVIVAEHVEFRNLPQSKTVDSPEVETPELETEELELEACPA
jgi:single-stranded DNA-binding protein